MYNNLQIRIIQRILKIKIAQCSDLYFKAILKMKYIQQSGHMVTGLNGMKTSDMVGRNLMSDDTEDKSQTSCKPSCRMEYKHIYDRSSNECLPHHCNTPHIPHSQEFHDLRGKREEIRGWNYMNSTIQWLSSTYVILTCVDKVRFSQVSNFFLLYLINVFIFSVLDVCESRTGPPGEDATSLFGTYNADTHRYTVRQKKKTRHIFMSLVRLSILKERKRFNTSTLIYI